MPNTPEEQQQRTLEELDQFLTFENPDFEKLVNFFIKQKDSLLGEGGAGKVFILTDACIKIMRNRHASPDAHMYNLGNTVQKEFEIQSIAHTIGEVSGVFTPKPYRFYTHGETNAFVMERLDAIDLQDVLMGKKKLPESFNLTVFIESLHDYISELNAKGIVHNDLEARNVMVDRLTGLPRLIDFGRSLYFQQGVPKNLENSDFDAVEKMHTLLEERL